MQIYIEGPITFADDLDTYLPNSPLHCPILSVQLLPKKKKHNEKEKNSIGQWKINHSMKYSTIKQVLNAIDSGRCRNRVPYKKVANLDEISQKYIGFLIDKDEK